MHVGATLDLLLLLFHVYSGLKCGRRSLRACLLACGGLAGSSLPLWTPAVTSASQNEVGSNPRGPGALAATHALVYAKLYIQQYIKTQSSKPTITARRPSIHSSISHSLINHSSIHSAIIYLVLHINKEQCWLSLREKRRLSFWSAVFKVNSNRTK